MKILFCLISIIGLSFSCYQKSDRKVFDVHLHGSRDLSNQLLELEKAGVYKAAISTSWALQNNYRTKSNITILYGLMFPCPEGKVPYSLQPCFENGVDWPSPVWVEQQIKEGRIDFLGELLNEYYGISPSDSLMFPYYALAEKYKLPVGVHTGGAGPNHGSPNFKIEMGNPLLMEEVLVRFPALKLWIMHSGDQYYKETIDIMKKYDRVYADISVISNPDIIPAAQFKTIMKTFAEQGLADRLMFGSDNANIEKVIASVEDLDFLTNAQKDKIFYQNAEHFFVRAKKE